MKIKCCSTLRHANPQSERDHFSAVFEQFLLDALPDATGESNGNQKCIAISGVFRTPDSPLLKFKQHSPLTSVY